MKKIYFLSFLLLAASLHARELTFTVEGTPVQNSGSVTFNNVEINDYGDFRDITMAPAIIITSDTDNSDISVKASSSDKIQLCAGGECEKGTSVTKSGIGLEAGKGLNIDFEYTGTLFPGDNVPTVTAEIEAWYSDDPATIKKFTIVMGPTASEIEIIAESGLLKAVEGAVEYNVDSPSRLSLISISGAGILTAEISGKGSLSTSTIPSGIYIYKIESGNTVNTGKIHIR